jgi:hypothetical protein
LNAFVPVGVGELEHRGHEHGGHQDKDTGASTQDQTVHNAPGHDALDNNGVLQSAELDVVIQLASQVIKEGEGWLGQCAEEGVAVLMAG